LFTDRAEKAAPEDLRVFTTVVRKASFAAAARSWASPAYVSKRIRLLEQELGVPLCTAPRAAWWSPTRASACSTGRSASWTTWISCCRR
jgi:hypothetical protein